MDQSNPLSQIASVGSIHTSSVQREDIMFRMKTHVTEFICPGCPKREELGSASVFAGGGITNCPDWQEELLSLVEFHIAALSGSEGGESPRTVATIINPRRSHFPINDPTASSFQINWEAAYLAMCKATSFWFPKNTEGPITLFETGKWMMRAKPFFLGIEPGYPRTRELLAHINAVRPDLEVASSLSDHAKNIALWALGMGRISLPQSVGVATPRTLYLSGGIAHCPDWQSEFEKLLYGVNLTLINPRRKDFLQAPEDTYTELVRENRKRLDCSEATVIWFPKEQLAPIALLELGSLLAQNKPLFIGIEEGYRRQIDVEIQTKLERPELDISYSLEALAEQVRMFYRMR